MDNPFRHMSKPEIYAALAGFVAIGGYLAVKHHSTTGSWNPFSSGSSASTTSPTTSTTAIDPVTGLPVSQDDAIDPVTGLTYLAEATQYGSVAAAEADVSAYGGGSGGGSGVGVQPAYPVSGSPSGTQTGSPYTSNAAWAQAVQAGLTDVGYDATTVAAALGAYLTSTPVTAAQAAIINTAIGEYGPAPVGNLQVILQPTAGTGTTGGTAPTTAPGAVTGLSVTPHAGYADFGWQAVSNADNYNLVISGPQAVNRDTGNATAAEHVTLTAGKYTARIRANNHGKYGPWSASKTFTVAANPAHLVSK